MLLLTRPAARMMQAASTSICLLLQKYLMRDCFSKQHTNVEASLPSMSPKFRFLEASSHCPTSLHSLGALFAFVCGAVQCGEGSGQGSRRIRMHH